MSRLVRLRADPAKIRVAVQHQGTSWMARIIRKRDGFVISGGISEHPEEAAELALKGADGFEGVDRYCDDAYEHPQKATS